MLNFLILVLTLNTTEEDIHDVSRESTRSSSSICQEDNEEQQDENVELSAGKELEGKSTGGNQHDENVTSVRSKRKSAVPKLVDNNLEKTLSAAQRDKILLEESKEDVLFRKELPKAMEDSNKSFSEAVEKLSTSITS